MAALMAYRRCMLVVSRRFVGQARRKGMHHRLTLTTGCHSLTHATNRDEEIWDNVDAKHGRHEHSEEDSCAQRVPCGRTGAAGDEEGDDTQDECEGRHENWSNTLAARFNRCSFDRQTLRSLLERELHDQNRVLGFEEIG